MSTLEERSAERRRRMVAHTANSPEEAEAWDLDYWQQAGPEHRLSALVAIHDDLVLVIAAKAAADRSREP